MGGLSLCCKITNRWFCSTGACVVSCHLFDHERLSFAAARRPGEARFEPISFETHTTPGLFLHYIHSLFWQTPSTVPSCPMKRCQRTDEKSQL